MRITAKTKQWLDYARDIRKQYAFAPLREIKNGDGRLHCDDGPAYISPTRCIEYRDGQKHGLDVDVWGSKTYYFQGVMVPPRFVNDPENIALDEILNHPNAEVRRVGMTIYGFERMEEEGHFTVVNEDEDTGARLLKFDVKNKNDEALVLVRVINSTAELDGTYKAYYLCVPPEMTTCREAIAWTFRRDADDYHPEQES